MSFITTLNGRISTLGPLHLGTGEDYYPTGYVIKEGYLHAFDDHALLAGMGKDGVSQLAQLAEQARKEALPKIQRLIYDNAENLLPFTNYSIWTVEGIQSFYEDRILGKESDYNKLQIHRTFANPHTCQPIIAGSAIKGAIRTAWLDLQNAGKEAEDDPKSRDGKEKSDRLQKRVLGYKKVEEDGFSLLKISDASYLQSSEISGREIWFGISKKRNQAETKRPPYSGNFLLECISPWLSRAFAFDIRLMKGASMSKIPTSINELIFTCNSYYLPKLIEELNTLGIREGYFSRAWLDSLLNLLNGELGQALNQGKAMLLRLGKHSGAEDKTLNGARHIKIMRQGQSPAYRKRTIEVRLASPVERKEVNRTTTFLPFGWVLVEFEDTDLPQTHAFLRQQAEPAYQRRQQEAAWIKRREDELQQQAKKAEELRQRELEKAAQAEAEKQRLAAFAALPPELQELEKFKEILSKDTASAGKGLGSPLANELRNLVNNAQSWAPEWKAKALECVELAFKHLVVDRKKNDKAKALWKQLA